MLSVQAGVVNARLLGDAVCQVGFVRFEGGDVGGEGEGALECVYRQGCGCGGDKGEQEVEEGKETHGEGRLCGGFEFVG